MKFIKNEIKRIEDAILYRYMQLTYMYITDDISKYRNKIVRVHNKIHQLMMQREKCILLIEVYLNLKWESEKTNLRLKYQLPDELIKQYNIMMNAKVVCRNMDDRKVEKTRLKFNHRHTTKRVEIS